MSRASSAATSVGIEGDGVHGLVVSKAVYLPRQGPTCRRAGEFAPLRIDEAPGTAFEIAYPLCQKEDSVSADTPQVRRDPIAEASP